MNEQLETAERKLRAGLAEHPQIPDHMHDGLIDYVLHGLRPGHFLSAILNNDLREACNRADEANFSAIPYYIRLLYNYAPQACWGKDGTAEAWCRQGGLSGIYGAVALVEG